MNLYAIISLIAFVLSIVLGITVFSLAPRRLIGRAFIIGILFLLVVEFSVFMIFLQKDQVLLWGKIAMASFCFLPPTWALISLVYGRTNYRELLKRRIWYLSLLYGLSLIFFILLWKFDFFTVPRSFPKDIFLISNFGKYFLIFALLSAVLILINFENTFRLAKISSRKGRKFPLYVLTSAFLFWVYAVSQMLMYSRISSGLALTGFIVIIATNMVLIVYSIKYGLMQLEVSLGREVVYSSAMIFIVGVYLLIIGIAGKIVQYAGGSVNIFLTFLAALVVFFVLLALLVSKSLKERVKIFVDRNFYKNRYDYREQWGQFSESLSAVLNLDEVLKIIIDNITTIFSTNKGTILLSNELTGKIVVRKTKDIHNLQDIEFDQQSEFIDWFHRFAEAVEIKMLINQAEQLGINELEKENLEKLKATVCVPLIVQTKFMGILALGEKEQNEPYSKEDFDLLETLANQSSVAILNAKLNEDLIVSKEMESFHKLSSFVLHDLKNSVSMLSMIIKNAERNWEKQEFRRDMVTTISNAVSKMRSIISKISTLPDKLVPKREMVGINDLITRIIRENKIKDEKNISYKENFQKLPLIAIDPEQIQKVIENLVINAMEAMPKGGDLQISTKVIENQDVENSNNGTMVSTTSYVEIMISDTGMGIPQEFIQNRLFKPFQTTKKKGLGIGLYQCWEIVIAHGGKIEVESKENKGTCFIVLLPILDKCNLIQNNNHIKYENVVLLN